MNSRLLLEYRADILLEAAQFNPLSSMSEFLMLFGISADAFWPFKETSVRPSSAIRWNLFTPDHCPDFAGQIKKAAMKNKSGKERVSG